MRGWFRASWWPVAAVLLLPWSLAAQLKLGELTAKSDGTVSTGYTASYGNLSSSQHGWTFGGAGNFTGSYYTPNFLSYNASVYLNQSRANSDFQSISDASGVDLSANIFSGSKFPGSVNFAEAYDSEGNYAVPGLANYVTHGNSDTFGINWNENLSGVPSFSAGYQTGNSNYSVYGTNDQGTNAFHSLNLHTGYKLEGFNMSAYYTLGGGHSLIPEVVSGLTNTEMNTDNSAEGFNINHPLPLHGSASLGFSRSDWSGSYLGSVTSGAVDLTNALATLHPTEKLALSVSANYSDNLSGQLIQSVLSAGGNAAELNSDQSSNSLDLMGVASYATSHSLQTSLFAERRTQSFLGENYGVNSYGGSATYTHRLFDGSFNSSVSATANTSDNTGQDTLGFSTTENYSNVIDGWHVTESFGYSQNAQTLIVTYLNSFYNYSANVRRRWGQFNLSMGAGGGRTALTEQAGTASSSQSYTAGIGYGSLLTATASYSRAGGQALATGSGLVPVPVPSPTLPSNLVSLYGGDSYSFGLSSSPAKRLTIAAAYAKAISNTTSVGIVSENQNSQFNSLVQYQFRKMNIVSGYARLEQGFSQTGTKPEIISSYYAGVSRWFNFF